MQPNSGQLDLFGNQPGSITPLSARSSRFADCVPGNDAEFCSLTVAQNLLLPDEPTNRWGGGRRREAARRVLEHLERLGLSYINPRSEIGDLDLPVRQKLEIARAVFRNPRVLVLDEPTSSLSGPDIDWLGQIIVDTKARGASVIFHLASHAGSECVLRVVNGPAKWQGCGHRPRRRTARGRDHPHDHRPLLDGDVSRPPVTQFANQPRPLWQRASCRSPGGCAAPRSK